MGKYKAGVLFGEDLKALYQDAKDNQFAMPAVNTTGTDTINATLEAAAAVNSPVIIQFSNGGAQFIAGKGMPNDKLQANISGAISGALHIHNIAKYYGVPVVLHTDHAAKKWLPWNNTRMKKVNPSSANTCLTSVKSHWRKTLKHPLSFTKGWHLWAWVSRLNWV